MGNSHRVIISGLISGDKEEFLKLYDLYYKSLCRFAFRFIRDLNSAEDIVQDTFLKLWKNRHSIREDIKLEPYLYTCVKNNAINYLNSEIKEKKIRESLVLNSAVIEYVEKDANEEDRLVQKVKEIIKTIPPKSQEVLTLSRYQGLKHKEIAEKLNITVKGVEYHITKALKHLEKGLAGKLQKNDRIRK